MTEEELRRASQNGAAERGMRQLFDSYETAIRKTGASTDNLHFEAFKRSIVKKAKELKSQYGVKKLNYKVVVRDGKVALKASAKE